MTRRRLRKLALKRTPQLRASVLDCASHLALLVRLLDPNSVEKGSRPAGIRIGIRSGISLAHEVALHGQEGCLRAEVGASLEAIKDSANALPGHLQAGCAIGRSQHFQDGRGNGRVGTAAPLLPVVHSVMVGVRLVRGSVCGQAIPLQPRVGNRGVGF